MGLIKSNQAPRTLASFSMLDVETHAKQIIIRSQQKAEQMLAAAQVQAEQLALQIQQDAFEQGVAAGRIKGIEDGAAAGKASAIAEFRGKFEQAIELFSNTLKEFDSQRSNFESQAYADVISLAVSIARRVTQQQGAQQPHILTDNVKQAVRLVAQQSSVTITINSAQRQFLDEMLPELKKNWPKVGHVEVQTDDAIQHGGCRVAAGGCEINAELDRQIDRIVTDLLPSEPAA